MQRNNCKFIISALLIAIFAVVGLNAGGPLYMWNAEQRIPYRWDVSSPVPVYTDIGPFEIVPPPYTPISNEVADGIVEFATQQWTNVETSSFQAQVVGDFATIGLPDITGSNAGLVIGPDNDGGGIHFIYDADASIISDFFGAPPNVLGIASPEWADEATGILTEGWVVLNAQQRWEGDEQLLNYAGVFTHEFGHAINLAHSQTNGAVAFFFDPGAPASCWEPPYNPYGVTRDDIETMYPFINPVPTYGSGLAQSTVDRTDDKVAISNLYPAPGYPGTHGAIKGKILETNGKTGITGVNVIARNLDDPYRDAVSAMSGDYVRVAAGNDGNFTLTGLTPGARYALYTDMIVGGGFPTLQPMYMPEGEEFYNGRNESSDGVKDNRCQISEITAVTGSATMADITLNSVKGAPKFNPMLPGAFPRTISSDGRVVGGTIAGGGTFRWTEKGGYEVLNQSENTASVMSRDGNWFASETQGPEGYESTQSSILQLGGSWQRIPVPVPPAPAVAQPCDTTSHSWGIAANGKAVSGMYWVDANGPAPGGTCRAWPFLWTPENGSVALPIPPNTRSSRPNNMSDDGSTIVGWWDPINGTGLRRGARWTNGHFQEFSTPDLEVGEAQNVTPDGSTIVGGGAGDMGEAWLWTQDGGLKILGRIGFMQTAFANAVSDDGKIVAGLGGSNSFFPGDVSGRRAFLWTEELGFVDFEDFLKAQGTSFEGWILNTAVSMSADGLTHLGSAFGPRGGAGWIIKLDKVNMCHAPTGNPANTRTINVPFNSGMKDHLSHGDIIGVCVVETE